MGGRSVTIALPSYLDEPRTIDGRTYGTLRRRDALWVVEGEPFVVQLAKRLFPGSSSGQRGEAVFPASARLIGDLNWLMLRYPLEIADPPGWAAAIEASRQHARKSYAIRRQPEALEPESSRFDGRLQPFQAEGVAFLVHHRRTLLADEMGLGKTVQALAFLATLPEAEAYPALVVVQPHVVRQWERMVRQFLPGIAVRQLRTRTPYAFDRTGITLVHYGLLDPWRHHIDDFRTVVFDEVQELRRGKSKKYSAASAICDAATNVIGLSGTPIHNAGGEIWNVLNVIETHCLGDWHSFTREWCHGYGSEVVVDPKVLGARLRDEGLYLRRTKDEVLEQLPPKRRVIEEVDAESGTFGELIRPVLELIPKLDATTDHFDAVRLREEVVNQARRATGIAKAPFVADFVAALLDAGEPGVVFAHHHAVVDVLAAKLWRHKPVVISGRQTQAQKDEALSAMVSGEASCAILSLRTTAGIDGLQQRCRWCVFAELDWSPAVHSQAEDRLHRMGLRDSVLAYYLVWNEEGSSDPDILSRLGFKSSQFLGLMGGEVDGDEQMLGREKASDHLRAVVERLRQLASNSGGVR